MGGKTSGVDGRGEGRGQSPGSGWTRKGGGSKFLGLVRGGRKVGGQDNARGLVGKEGGAVKGVGASPHQGAGCYQDADADAGLELGLAVEMWVCRG